MRVGIFDPYLDTLGGGEKYALTVASCLSKNNEVDLFWENDRELIKKAEKRFGIDLSRIKLTNNIFSKDTSLVSRIASSRKYDLIFFLSDGSIPITFSKNLVLHFQFPVEWIDGESFITKVKMKFVKKIICNSKFTKSFIDKTFGVNSTVLYPPADVGIMNYESTLRHGSTGLTTSSSGQEIKGKENVILTVGRFGRLPEGNNFKKQDMMIRTFKKMVDGGLSGWEFILVISYKEQDVKGVKEFEKLVKGYPIKILKNLNKNEILKIYQKAKIYWHAAGFGEDLIKHPERAEHFGISTVEAMGAGAVPVVINIGGQREIVENEKSGFLWETEEELIVKTNSLIENADLWNKTSKAAIEKSKVFSRDRFCKELEILVV